MLRLLAAMLLAFGSGAAAVEPENSMRTAATPEQADQRQPDTPTTAARSNQGKSDVPVEQREVADQAALETQPFAGPQFGKSRVERRREKCRSQAQAQGLTGAARQQHLRSCVKR